MPNLKITQTRSTIGRPPDQRRTLRALGLRRIGHSVVRPDTPDLRGMIFKVSHLVDVSHTASSSASEERT